MLVHVGHFISHFFTELEIYNLSLFITRMTISTLPILAVRKTHVIHEPCIRPNSLRVLRIAEVRASDRCTEGHCVSIPVGDSEFFFVQCSWHVDHIISHFFTELKIYHFSFIFEDDIPLKWELPCSSDASTVQHSTVKMLQTVNLLPWSCSGDYTVDQCSETTLILFRPLCLLNGEI